MRRLVVTYQSTLLPKKHREDISSSREKTVALTAANPVLGAMLFAIRGSQKQNKVQNIPSNKSIINSSQVQVSESSPGK
jgi:hypothetical protein